MLAKRAPAWRTANRTWLHLISGRAATRACGPCVLRSPQPCTNRARGWRAAVYFARCKTKLMMNAGAGCWLQSSFGMRTPRTLPEGSQLSKYSRLRRSWCNVRPSATFSATGLVCCLPTRDALQTSRTWRRARRAMCADGEPRVPGPGLCAQPVLPPGSGEVAGTACRTYPLCPRRRC